MLPFGRSLLSRLAMEPLSCSVPATRSFLVYEHVHLYPLALKTWSHPQFCPICIFSLCSGDPPKLISYLLPLLPDFRTTGSSAYRTLTLRCCIDISSTMYAKGNLSASPTNLFLALLHFHHFPKSWEGGQESLSLISCPNTVLAETLLCLIQIPAVTSDPAFPPPTLSRL